MSKLTCFVSGATGLLGGEVARRLAADRHVERVYSLERAAAGPAVRGASAPASHVVVRGDLRDDGLGIDPDLRARLAREVTTVVHLAANTSFSQPLDEAREVNRDGTRRLLELSADWRHVDRWVYVSTAFVAGLRTGGIAERDHGGAEGFANAYEQSKAEAEALVRGARSDWAIARPATVVCDDATGRITQMNAVHRALRLYFGGLAAMLPGTECSTVDVITTDYAARGIVRAALAAGVERQTFHLCAGAGAMGLDELLDVSYAAFLRSPAWRQRGIARPLRTDWETYRIFESAIHDAGSERVIRALRGLSHFVPHLAFPKQFETTNADALLGEAAPRVAGFWSHMVDQLVCDAPTWAAA